MTARTEDLDHLPYWPRLLSRVQAAAYVGVAPSTFDGLGMISISIGARKLYDRKILDEWVDCQTGGDEGYSIVDSAFGREV